MMLCHTVDDDLWLALLEAKHAPSMFAMVDRERARLGEWLPWVDRTQSVTDTLKFIEGTRRSFAESKDVVLGVWYQGRIAGTVGIHDITNEDRSAFIGYWLGVEFEGKGIMSMCCLSMVDHAFSVLGLNRLEIRCSAKNTRSQAIPERIGFRREGTLIQAERHGNEYRDVIVYGLLSCEWNQEQGVR
ncbi:MAG: GNAT family N-acetyltransferase [Candidatus Schekmanbacteria bacterium]|nr:GNAT family N-acetyltransferase [Candidatus Schekmanbacteria bacterium]